MRRPASFVGVGHLARTRRVWALVCAVALLVLAAAPSASAGDPAWSPLKRPGPELRVDKEKLRASLTCSEGVRDAEVQPVLLTPATGVDSKNNFSWNYERLFDQEGIPWCASDQFGRRSTNNTNIQVRGEYVVYAIRKMAKMAGRKIAVMGHSQGGMVMRWPLRFWPDTRELVEDVIGMAGTNRGTTQADGCDPDPCTAANHQQAASSNFIAALNSRAETFAGISYTEIYTPIDEVVTPQPHASIVAGPGDITNVSITDVCPNDPNEHLGIGTVSPTAAALALDALQHPGPADPERIDPAVCAQQFQPGINPATFLADVAAAAAQLQTSTAPETPTEPRLRCYVYKDLKTCRKARFG
jgi:triacylglycerol esterase/lipase EstA (alpha/beta hydrolase family)